jgi:hypothetical protein
MAHLAALFRYNIDGIPNVVVIDREGHAKVPAARDDLIAYAQGKSSAQER